MTICVYVPETHGPRVPLCIARSAPGRNRSCHSFSVAGPVRVGLLRNGSYLNSSGLLCCCSLGENATIVLITVIISIIIHIIIITITSNFFVNIMLYIYRLRKNIVNWINKNREINTVLYSLRDYSLETRIIHNALLCSSSSSSSSSSSYSSSSPLLPSSLSNRDRQTD